VSGKRNYIRNLKPTPHQSAIPEDAVHHLSHTQLIPFLPAIAALDPGFYALVYSPVRSTYFFVVTALPPKTET
jgi:hypothetical protein